MTGKQIKTVDNVDMLRSLMVSRRAKFEERLPDGETFEKFVPRVELAFIHNLDLLKCSNESIMQCLFDCAATGLDITSKVQPHAYLIKRGTTCCFDLSYHGYLHLARRSGAIVDVKTGVVREGDEAYLEYGDDNDTLTHKPVLGSDAPIIAYYARFHLPSGRQRVACMTRKQVEQHRDKYSQAKGPSSPWATSFDQMALKTVIKQPFLRGEIAITGDASQRIIESDSLVETDAVLEGEVVSAETSGEELFS